MEEAICLSAGGSEFGLGGTGLEAMASGEGEGLGDLKSHVGVASGSGEIGFAVQLERGVGEGAGGGDVCLCLGPAGDR